VWGAGAGRVVLAFTFGLLYDPAFAARVL